MLKMKFIFVLIAMACLISNSHCSSSDRSLAGCITGLNRCSEAISWFSNLFMESCNDYCVRSGTTLNSPFCILLSWFSYQHNLIIVNQVRSAELAFFNRPIANSDPKVLLFAIANAIKQTVWFRNFFIQLAHDLWFLFFFVLYDDP